MGRLAKDSLFGGPETDTYALGEASLADKFGTSTVTSMIQDEEVSVEQPTNAKRRKMSMAKDGSRVFRDTLGD